MRVAVLGAGAIGLLYGGWLQQGGADVIYIRTRRPAGGARHVGAVDPGKVVVQHSHVEGRV